VVENEGVMDTNRWYGAVRRSILVFSVSIGVSNNGGAGSKSHKVTETRYVFFFF